MGNSNFVIRKRNLLKLATLQLFEEHVTLTPPAWAVRAEFYPIRAAYSYLKRLSRFGLLRRAHIRRGRVTYEITRRGRERLQWLQQQRFTKG